MSAQSQFQVRQFDQRTLSWWKNRRAEIDMAPPYQRRGRLWSTADKAYLIDSIVNGFDIPKIYIADFSWGSSPLNTRRLPYAIIDGKQRLEAIFDFFDGRLVLNQDFKYLKDPGLHLGGLSYRDLVRLHSDIAEEFENYNLHVMSVFAQSEDLINDLFVRLNRSKPLTGAEIRNAMGGPVPKMLREIADREFFTDIVAFSAKRGQDLNTAAKFLIFEYSDRPRETKKTVLDRFVESATNFAADERSKLELSARRVLDVVQDMTSVFLPKDRLLGSAGAAPVYFWLVRSLNPQEQSRVRPFLVEFEETRKHNRSLLPDQVGLDAELIEYDNYNRNANDQASHEGRYRILLKRFRQSAGG